MTIELHYLVSYLKIESSLINALLSNEVPLFIDFRGLVAGLVAKVIE